MAKIPAQAEPEMNVNVSPEAMAIGKILVALGVAGLVAYLSPWTFETLMMGLVAPLLVVVTIGACFGLVGKSTLDLIVLAGERGIWKQVQRSIQREALV